jgi:hypothetical protein
MRVPRPRGPFDRDVGGFVGVGLAPGFSYVGGPGFEPSFNLSLRLGLLFRNAELAIDFSPYTFLPDGDRYNLLHVGLTYGQYYRITRNYYWPMRFGLGGVVGVQGTPATRPQTGLFLPGDTRMMVSRLDLIGLAYATRHWIFEVNAGSLRISTDFTDITLYSVLFNLGISYVF